MLSYLGYIIFSKLNDVRYNTSVLINKRRYFVIFNPYTLTDPRVFCLTFHSRMWRLIELTTMTNSFAINDENGPFKQPKWSKTQWCKIGFSIPLLVTGIALLLTLNAGVEKLTERKCIKHMSAWCNVIQSRR